MSTIKLMISPKNNGFDVKIDTGVVTHRFTTTRKDEIIDEFCRVLRSVLHSLHAGTGTLADRQEQQRRQSRTGGR